MPSTKKKQAKPQRADGGSGDITALYQDLETAIMTPYTTTQSANKQTQKRLVELEKARKLILKQSLDSSEPVNIAQIYPDIRQPDFNVALSKHPMIAQYAPILKSSELASDLYREYGESVKLTSDKSEYDVNVFKHSSVQKMLRNFMDPKTPYRGLLIIHGTGVGKTCTAITIAEALKEYEMDHGAKIYVIRPDEFRRQIFEKGVVSSGNPQMQCTGETYLDAISTNPRNKESIIDCQKGRQEACKAMEQSVKKVIKRYYDFATDYLWAKKVNSVILAKTKNITDPAERQRKTVDIIRKIFNNSVLIVDEAHNLRNIGRTGGPVKGMTAENDKPADAGDADDNTGAETGADEDGEASGGIMVGNILNKVLLYSQNMRLILLSATPMYDKPQDIVPLLNYLLLNDKRPKIAEKDLFDKDGNLRHPERLVEASRGYVSYVRGNDPVNFPLRLTAEVNLPASKIFNTEKYPETDVIGQHPVEQRVQHLKLVDCPMADDQQALLLKLIGSGPAAVAPTETHENSNKTAGDETNPEAENSKDVLDDDLAVSEAGDEMSVAYARELQASNYIYQPLAKADGAADQCYGIGGFNSITEKVPGQLTFKFRDPDAAKQFTGTGLQKHGPKIYECLENIKRAQGPVFVYSYYTKGGVLPMAFALEMAGYTRYGGEKPLLDSKFKPSGPSKGEYIVYIGNKLFSRGANKFLDLRQGMINEKNVKVVLASKKGSEGLNLFGFREIHLIDPWHNINLLEQTIGRVIRNQSHHHLPPQFRNVCVYMYATTFAGSMKHRESVDLHVYAICENKAVRAGEVEMILKENAVDCTMNKALNYRSKADYPKPVDIVTSNGRTLKYEFWDKPYSRDTLYMPKSDFKCIAETGVGDGMLRPSSRDKLALATRILNKELSMYKIEIDEIIATIKQILRTAFNLLESDIWSIIHAVLHTEKGAGSQTMARNIYQYIIDYLTNEDIIILDKFGRECKIVPLDVDGGAATKSSVLRLIPLTNYNKRQPVTVQDQGFIRAMDYDSGAGGKLTKKQPKHAQIFAGAGPTRFEKVDQVQVYPLVQKLRKDKVRLLDKEELNYKTILIKLNNQMSSIMYKHTTGGDTGAQAVAGGKVDDEVDAGFGTNMELTSNYGLPEVYKLLFDRLIYIEKLFVLQYLCLKVKIGDSLSGFERNLFDVIQGNLVSKSEVFSVGGRQQSATTAVNYLSSRDELYGFIIARFNKLTLYKVNETGLPEPGTISDSKLKEYYTEDKAKVGSLVLRRAAQLEAQGVNNLFGYMIYSQNENLAPIFKITDFITKGRKKSVKGVTCSSKPFDEIMAYVKVIEPKYRDIVANVSTNKKMICGDLEIFFRLAHSKSGGRPAYLLDPEQYYIWSSGTK